MKDKILRVIAAYEKVQAFDKGGVTVTETYVAKHCIRPLWMSCENGNSLGHHLRWEPDYETLNDFEEVHPDEGFETALEEYDEALEALPSYVKPEHIQLAQTSGIEVAMKQLERAKTQRSVELRKNLEDRRSLYLEKLRMVEDELKALE